ncbi:MAG TPA: chalcone isomerase [Planctomycetaceae bacterium]|nr:chalcone isomerase [Planctomycetaceae bacterium]
MGSRNLAGIASIVVFALASPSLAELPGQITVGKQTLKLNGAGMRTKTFVNIYESGLYLAAPSTDAQKILAADELMSIRVKITSGFVSRSSLVKSFQESLKASTGGKTDKIAKETQALLSALSDEVKKNDIYDFLYVPSRGLYVMKNGKVKGTIPGLHFKQALYGIWLSDSPVDKSLRQALLSGGKRR